jgi:cation:H+ antiporter
VGAIVGSAIFNLLVIPVALLTPPLALLPLATYGIYVFLQYQDTRDYVAPLTPTVRVRREWGRVLVSLALITVGVEGIVRAALGFGEAFGTPSVLWGLTVIAAGTSLPDAFVSVSAAKKNDDITSLTNVLGSNTFNLLVAIPVGILIAGSVEINFLTAVPLMGFLSGATLIFVVFTRTHLELSDSEAVTLLVLYGLFLAWMTLESVGAIDTVRGI